MFFSKYFKFNIQLRRGTVQDGQNSLLQLGVSLIRVIKCFFSSKLNSSLFLINLICSEGKSAHNLGKENKGILEMVTLRLKGMAMSSSSRSSTWSWPSLLILFVTQVLLKQSFNSWYFWAMFLVIFSPYSSTILRGYCYWWKKFLRYRYLSLVWVMTWIRWRWGWGWGWCQ